MSGSLSERAQWASAGGQGALSAVEHFRLWQLGGQPIDLWPDPIVRLLAAERWVEERARREGAPDPELILCYGEKMRAIARGGTLAALKDCASHLVHEYGWPEGQAVRFVITGVSETISKVRGRLITGVEFSAAGRVVMDVDPRTSDAEVVRLYQRWRRSLGLLQGRTFPERDREMNQRTLDLAVFIEENWSPGAAWSELLELWNRQNPHNQFRGIGADPGAHNFSNHARHAWKLVTGEPWPSARRVPGDPVNLSRQPEEFDVGMSADV